MKHPHEMRHQLERDAARFFFSPEDANCSTDTIRHSVGGGPENSVDVVWASRGRPDRRKVILYLHGGAYIAGSPATHKHLAAFLAGASGMRAIVPDYRLAPEAPFPAGLMDAAGTYLHLLDVGYDPASIALAGDSAGGGLVFALLLWLAENRIPAPACAVGFSPWVDLTGQGESITTNAKRDVMLPARRLQEVAQYYLNGQDAGTPCASPLFGAWIDPPPVLLTASRSEILLDDTIRLAHVLRAAGGNVQVDLWQNLPHAWPIAVGRLREADKTVESAGRFIARHLGEPSKAKD